MIVLCDSYSFDLVRLVPIVTILVQHLLEFLFFICFIYLFFFLLLLGRLSDCRFSELILVAGLKLLRGAALGPLPGLSAHPKQACSRLGD
jgi:hypothetical protein